MARARKRVLDHDPFSGTTTFWHESADDNAPVVIETVQDVGAIVEQNKALYAGIDERARFGTGFDDRTHVAFIPDVIAHDLMRRGVLDDPAALRAWLNDSGNRAFRTRPGRV